MAQDEKIWHPRFIQYMKKIINHPNYKGLPIKKKPDGTYAWIATAKSEIGKLRDRKTKNRMVCQQSTRSRINIRLYSLSRNIC